MRLSHVCKSSLRRAVVWSPHSSQLVPFATERVNNYQTQRCTSVKIYSNHTCDFKPYLHFKTYMRLDAAAKGNSATHCALHASRRSRILVVRGLVHSVNPASPCLHLGASLSPRVRVQESALQYSMTGMPLRLLASQNGQTARPRQHHIGPQLEPDSVHRGPEFKRRVNPYLKASWQSICPDASVSRP